MTTMTTQTTTTQTTRRYALIDSNSGYVWGLETAASPIAACRQCDEGVGEHGLEYEDISRAAAQSGREHYRVYDASTLAGDVEDGQAIEAIEAVEALPLVARIAWKR